MLYAIFVSLFFLSFINVLNGLMAERFLQESCKDSAETVIWKARMNKIVGLLIVSLIGVCFWLYGWKYGAGAIVFTWASAIIMAWPAKKLADKRLYDADWAKYSPSALSLLCPIAAVVWASYTPASVSQIVGYGISNLGYLLLASAIFSGTFNIFRLTKRWQVVTVGLALLAIGTVIVNLK